MMVDLDEVLRTLRLAKAGDDHPRWHEGIQCAIEMVERMRRTPPHAVCEMVNGRCRICGDEE